MRIIDPLVLFRRVGASLISVASLLTVASGPLNFPIMVALSVYTH